MPKRWTPEEDKYLRTHYRTSTLPEIAEEMGVPYGRVRKRANYLRLSRVDVRHRRMVANWLPRLSSVKVAYLAGIIDGEGTVSLHKTHPTGRKTVRYQPHVSITNTNPELEEVLRDTLGATYWRRARPRPGGNWKPCWVMGWYGYKVLPLLKVLVPHLVVKKRQAELVMDFIHSRLAADRYNPPYTETQVKLYETVRDLNRKGLHPS